MQALKDVGEITALLSNTPLSASPLWDKPLDELHPAQLHAFLTRLTLDGHGEEARRIAEIVMAQIHAVQTPALAVPILGFAIPQERMTLGELRAGLQTLTRPRPAAVLFGLEADLEIDSLITLKWDRANDLRQSGTLSKMAHDVLRLMPRHLGSPYVFWQEINGAAAPLFGLSLELADVFDMEWSELRNAYRTIIKLDPDAERLMWITRI
jgi:hypothetical protein